MKIVIFIENNQFGGLDTFCRTLLDHWPDEKDSFVVVCNASHPGQMLLRQSIGLDREFLAHDIPLSWTLSKKFFGWLPGSIRRLSQPFIRVLLKPIQLSRLRTMFRAISGDALLVVNGGYPAGETCRLANIAWAEVSNVDAAKRNIHNFHNFAISARYGFRWYERQIDKKLAQVSSRIISVSRACTESLYIRPAFRRYKRTSVIYNGVSMEQISDTGMVPNLRLKLGIGKAPMCLILANYEERKGHRFLFQAFAEVVRSVPEAHLVCCGGGSDHEKNEIENARRILAPNAKIHLLDFIPNGNHLIDQADLLLISSQSFESFGLTAVEAMLRAVPVVATRVGGLPEVLGEPVTGGYLVDFDDVNGFADSITELLTNPSQSKRIGAEGKSRAEVMFTADRMAREYHDLLKCVVGTAVPRTESEWKYVFRRCINPRMATQTLMVAGDAVLRRSLNRIINRRDYIYPPVIKKLSHTLPTFQVPHVKFPEADLVQGSSRLKLAIGWLHFDVWPNWDTQFDDHEQYVSLHRWNWLLYALTDEDVQPSFTWGADLVRSWVTTMTCFPDHDAGESYTTGERISNLCLFARHTLGDWDSLPEDLLALVREMALDLARRLEYHKGELSGNHVINNARAMLLAGHCAKVPQLVSFARALIAERLPKLIKSGFLREGSSHYQFLFTRWVLELMMLAREREDHETAALIEPYLSDLFAACDFFRVRSANEDFLTPTFGDISPDAEPGWLNELSTSALVCKSPASGRRGWARLFPDARSLNISQVSMTGAWRAYPDAGWYRLDFLDWVAIWHAESSDGPAIASHAHHDTCSLVLYRKGHEVLIDPGRFDYSGSPFGNYGISTDGHNSVSLDDRAPMLSRGDRLFPALYREAICNVVHLEHETEVLVQITHNGFERLGCGIAEHNRTFTFRKEEVLIQDVFQGIGSYRMEARFHQPLIEPIRFEAGLYDQPVHYSSLTVELISNQSEKLQQEFIVANEFPLGGWRFPAYGIKEAALTQRFIGMIDLPASYQYRVVDKRE